MVGDRVEPEDPRLAGDGSPVALEGLDRRGLAGPVGTEDHQHLAGLGGEVHAVDRWGRADRPVAHGEAGDGDGGHGVAGYFEQE